MGVFLGKSSLKPEIISGKDILEVIGQLRGPVQKVFGALECGSSQYVRI